MVRPAEPAWTTNQKLQFGGKSIESEGVAYVNALRDWVRNGAKSVYALSDEEFAKRVRLRTPEEMEAEASFKLAVYFHGKGDSARAAKHFQRAQQLQPDDWNYHRQEWSFGPDAGKKWMEKFQKQESPYYPPLALPEKK